MTWLTPLIAGISAAIAVPALVILYFLKLRRRDLEISSTLLWKKAIQDLQANAPFQRLRRNILLLLQLLALAAALLALGQPEIEAATAPGQRTVLMIDRSASMSTEDADDGRGGTMSRLEQSKRSAIEFIETMREPGVFSRDERDEAMVIAFDSGAEVVHSFTGDKMRLRSAIESILPSGATSSLEEAARLADAYSVTVMEEGRGLVTQPGAPIIMWSDGRLPDAARVKVNPQTPFTFHAVGAADTANVGVTALRAERAYDNPARLSVFVAMQSTDAQPRSVDVEFAVGGVVSAIRPVRLPGAVPPAEGGPGVATGGVVFELDRAEGGLARVRLLGEDPMRVDNEAWIVLPPARRLAALYVSMRDTFVLEAIKAQELSRLVTATPAQYEEMVKEGRDAEFEVIVLDGWAPEVFPPGRYLVFGAQAALAGVSPGAEEDAQPRIIIDWSREHPALRSVSMENLFIARSRPLTIDREAQGEARVLAESDHGPVIVEAAAGGARAIIVGFSVMNTNWVWDHNMVVFVASALRALAGESAAVLQTGVKPGGALTTRLPVGASDVELTLPDGSGVAVSPASDGQVSYGPVRDTGLYRFRWRGPGGPEDVESGGRMQRIIAANLLDPSESDVRTQGTLDLAARQIAAAGAGAAGGDSNARQSLWPWLLLGALAIVMLEWFVYNRKVHI